MESTTKTKITIEAIINAPISKVWSAWNNPEDVMKWNMASPDWHCPAATNDLRVGGKFVYTMAARDGSMSFDFEGVYTNVIDNELIEYVLADAREISIVFSTEGSTTRVVETFDPENENPVEMQRSGWQSILDNFKSYVENL
ncbi:MAG: SRPBCC family protein [Flavobacteriales bacterium]